MNLLIISGSQRKESQSAKVAKYLAEQAIDFTEVNHIELCRYNLPYWDGEQASKFDNGHAWELINHQVKKADALILITPEWGGMATPILKNFLLMCDQQDTAHKPALLVSVVSGISGAYPIAELRMNSLKNNKIVAAPDHLIIRNVTEVLDAETPVNERDTTLRERINYSLYMLHEYSVALQKIRLKHSAKPFPKQQEYAYGM